MKINNDVFWKNKRVLITGHTGFKGSWLAIWLKELGADVAGFALEPNSQKDNFVLSHLSQKIIDYRGDLRDFNKLLTVFKEFKPEIVFHLAAQALVGLSYQKPKDTYDINVGGTVNVLEATRITNSVKVAVIVTSDKCYDNKEWIWGYRENDPMGGYDPYSSSKGAAEIITSGYRNSFFAPERFDEHGKAICTVRAGNVIGGGDWSENRIIPDCIRSLIEKKPISIRNPQSVRPWQYVLEPLNGYLAVAKKMWEEPARFSEAWNFGPNFNSIVTVKEITEQTIKCWGSGEWVDLSENQTMHESNFLALDCNKAKIMLGWKPKLDIQKALEMTVKWYKYAFENNYKNDMYDFCVQQIKEYANR